MHSYLSTALSRHQAKNIVLLFALAITAVSGARAQTFSIIFNLPLSANSPWGSLMMDQAGNIYGTTTLSNTESGTAFKLKNSRGSWLFNPLLTFTQPDGMTPYSGLTVGPGGALYGTTVDGGTFNAGTVYALRPPQTFCRSVTCPWSRTLVYSFGAGGDGAYPYLGSLIFDSAGNMYGSTIGGGSLNQGTVFELSRSGGGNWTEKVLYSFAGGSDGAAPASAITFDAAGNIHGTTENGGNSSCSSGCGTVYKLTPSGSNWTETVIYRFSGVSDGNFPVGGIIFDAAGNMYGSTAQGGPNVGGTIFELSPNGGGWTYAQLYALTQGIFGPGGPTGNLVLNSSGALLGTTITDGANGVGNVFKLTHQGSTWTYADLHDFTAFDDQDGEEPVGTPILDAGGNLYGTTLGGGSQGCSFEVQCGTVWKVTPQ
ncbi:MAG TPA: choice-of-anchor tandem repeat GloVer-containing protein [Terriglobales bacterium]|nr:choice-of-anchor tandem repeat GloVer-containing protein [Terriglobales bacterium]